MLLLVNAGIAYAVHVVVLTLGADVLMADRDPLTGLYTRRAFYQRTASLAASIGEDGHLVVAMLDLDRFKRLNDTLGHSEGDLALAAVGDTLLGHARHGAVVCRAGGEEFLVADVFTEPTPNTFGQRLCDAVADVPYPVTASVGTASIRCDRIQRSGDPDAVITGLISIADTAMYVAKRNGSNRVRHHRPVYEARTSADDIRVWSPVGKRWERTLPEADGRADGLHGPSGADASTEPVSTGTAAGDHGPTPSAKPMTPDLQRSWRVGTAPRHRDGARDDRVPGRREGPGTGRPPTRAENLGRAVPRRERHWSVEMPGE